MRTRILGLVVLNVVSVMLTAVYAQSIMRVNMHHSGASWSFPYATDHFSHFDFSSDESWLRGYYTDADGLQQIVPFDVSVLDSLQFVEPADSLGKEHYNVFAMNITTVDGKDITSKEEYVDCYVSVDGAGEFDDFSGTARIRGRGNSTWLWYPKKPYRLKLDTKSKMLGLKKNRDWVLLANYRDPTDLMNTFAFETAQWMGLPFTNHTRYVEVFLNGDYIGVYQLTEQIEQGGHRVDISETEGVLLSFDLDDGPELSPDATDNFYSEVYSMPMCVKYPDEPTPEQIAQIRSDLAVLEGAIKAADYAMVDSLLDIKSYINMLQLQEFLYNVDFTAPRSVYMFRDAGGKYTLGPVWDWDAGYDFNWGSEHDFFGSFTRLMMGTDPYRQNGAYSMPRFFTDMFSSADFVSEYKSDWASRSDSIFTRNWNETYKYARRLMRGAYSRDSERWPIGKTVLTEISSMKKWLTNRKDYMDEVVANYPMPRSVKLCGTISCKLTLDYSRGYSQKVTVDVDASEVARLMGISVSQLTSADISILPLYRDGSIGSNGTNGVFGGWFDINGDPLGFSRGHVYIEVFDNLFSWNCGLRAEDGYCERGHTHVVTMQYQYPGSDSDLAVNVDVEFTID